MTGERNGTKAVLCRLDGGSNLEIVGQVELTNAFNGVPVDISTKSTGDWIKFMDGESSTKGRTITLNCIFNSETEYTRMCKKAQSGEIESYVIDYTALDADEIKFNGIPNQLGYNFGLGGSVTTPISIISTGEDL
jgi:hypothetical protein